MNSEKLKVNN